MATATEPDLLMATEALLKTISADQKNILTTLQLVLDGFESQTKLLKQLADLAKDDPGPSPLSERRRDRDLGLQCLRAARRFERR